MIINLSVRKVKYSLKSDKLQFVYLSKDLKNQKTRLAEEMNKLKFVRRLLNSIGLTLRKMNSANFCSFLFTFRAFNLYFDK